MVQTAGDDDGARSEASLEPATLHTPDIVALHAFEGGVALVRRGPSAEVPLVVQRAYGSGADVTEAGPVFAVRELLDVDAAGNLYVLPASAPPGTDLTSTLLEQSRVVVRVGPTGALTPLVDEGRGIWGFGVSPAGDALWVEGCSPTGIFAVTPEGLGERAAWSPETLAQGGVLTDASTFWSVGANGALVRTTPAGSVELPAAVTDASGGSEPGSLSRCGGAPCLISATQVVLLGAECEISDVLTWDDVDWWRGDSIVAASANSEGTYVSLQRGSPGAAHVRVVFVKHT